MPVDRVNDDFSLRVVLATDALPWVASPQPGVERRLLDRIGGEVARATSLVRYRPDSAFPAHDHPLGEEFLVLDGVFSDEHGDYKAGTYVRNPPGSLHAPRTGPGCTILVKLRQMKPTETDRVVIDSSTGAWESLHPPGYSRLALYSVRHDDERVALERLAPGTLVPPYLCRGGEELFLLTGDLSDGAGEYLHGAWIRNPDGDRHDLRSAGGAMYWVKRGHLPP
jgi:anti-sigma factor ChrR (cupin superfamily)